MPTTSTSTNTGVTVQLPSFSFVTVTTTVSVPDGGTVLLGGIKRLSEGRNEFGVPILSKIPYINRLFTNVGIGRANAKPDDDGHAATSSFRKRKKLAWASPLRKQQIAGGGSPPIPPSGLGSRVTWLPRLFCRQASFSGRVGRRGTCSAAAKPTPQRVFGDRARQHELQQIVRPPALVPMPDILNPPNGCRPTRRR